LNQIPAAIETKGNHFRAGLKGVQPRGGREKAAISSVVGRAVGLGA